MSDPSEIILIDNEMPYPIADAWWTVAGIIEAAAVPLEYQISDRRLDLDGMRATIAQNDTAYGRFSLTGDENKSALTIDHTPGSDGFWNILIDLLQKSATYAAVHRRRSWGMSADNAIERYYRIKAQNGKITMKQIAELTGFSYDYLRERKVQYDRAGKWGSKAHKAPTKNT